MIRSFSFMEVAVSQLNGERNLHTFDLAVIHGGGGMSSGYVDDLDGMSSGYVDDLDQCFASMVLVKIDTFVTADKKNAKQAWNFPINRTVVTKHVLDIVVEHLREKCGMAHSYVLNDFIVVTNVAQVPLQTAQGDIADEITRQAKDMPADTAEVDGVGTIAIAPLGGRVGQEVRDQAASMAAVS